MSLKDYPFKSRFEKPFRHQVETTIFILSNPRDFVLNTMGTGKTLSVLWAYDFLMINKKIDFVLVVCPLSIVYDVWVKELFMSFPHRKYSVLYGYKDKRVRNLNLKSDYYIINHDGVKVLENELINKFKGGNGVIIIDEATAFKNYSTDRTKSMYRLAKRAKGICTMTGSPTSESPKDAYGIAKVTRPNNPNLPPYYTRFRDKVIEKCQFDPYTWIPKLGWEMIVKQVLNPAIRFELDECIDLPPMVEETRKIDMSKEQQTMYDKMFKHLITGYENGVITASNAGVKCLKLLQISAGAVYDDDKNVVSINCTPKLNELINIWNEIDRRKMIVFSRFVGSIKLIHEFLEKQKINNRMIYGDVSLKERTAIFKEFRESDVDMLVMQPSTVAHGLDLTISSVVTWFTPLSVNEVVSQANARVRRPGQKHKQLVITLHNSPVERAAMVSLKNKISLSDSFIRLLKSKGQDFGERDY